VLFLPSSVVSCNTNANLFQGHLDLLQIKYLINLDFAAKILHLRGHCILVMPYVQYPVPVQTKQQFLVVFLRLYFISQIISFNYK